MSKWLNTKHILKGKGELKGFYKQLEKPCYYTGYCPYGCLVEEFNITKKPTKYSCKIFGHNCPAFYHAEPWCEPCYEETIEELKKLSPKKTKSMK